MGLLYLLRHFLSQYSLLEFVGYKILKKLIEFVRKSLAGWKTVFVLSGLSQAILILTLEAPITTAADDSHKYFFIIFQRK